VTLRFGAVLEKMFGRKSHRDYEKQLPVLEQIKAIRAGYRELSDDQLRELTEGLRARGRDGEDPDALLPEAYATVWEACRRLAERRATWPVWGQEQTWDMVPYDVQVVGAIVLHQGRITEMATGEGKTLVAVMPLYLNALSGKGAHLVTVNDYLARRDAEWMGGVLRFLGLTVGFIVTEMTPAERRAAYNCDVTYGTNNEFGFDYLRDNMAVHKDHLVHRAFNYAIVDEVDSVLVDEARTPLIISGAVDKSTHRFEELKPRVEQVVRLQGRLVNEWVTDVERVMKPGADDAEVIIDDATALKLLRISRGAPKHKRFRRLAQIPGVLETIQRTEANFMRDKAMWEADEDLLYVVEEKHHSVDLTEKGREALAQDEPDFFVLPDLAHLVGELERDNSLDAEEKARRLEAVERAYAVKNEQISNVDQLLRAYSIYEKDDEYVVQEGKILIVDEFTGRLMPGRRFSEGLHQALEAKEGVKVEKETQTLATITLQNFFRMYAKLAGMTGTAETEEQEFHDIYKLDVAVIPTNEPVRRLDYDDVIFRTKKEKYNAIVDEVARLHEKGLPVLVGTTTVEVSELLSRLLTRRGINHNVLNAKHHQREAEIVAGAGRRGGVTIATNMAGRGTDIKLDPTVLQCADGCHIACNRPACTGDGILKEKECLEDVPCGLHIIGTERHESRRIDRQLRGRAGRQGDPGASVFFLSLEDDLMRLFGSDRLIKIMDRLGVQEGEVITHRMVTRAIEKAQVRVEMQNFEIRKHLLEYDNVANKQREVIYGLRRDILLEDDVSGGLLDNMERAVARLVTRHCDPSRPNDDWDFTALTRDYLALVLAPLPVAADERLQIGHEALLERFQEHARQRHQTKEQRLTPELTRQLERFVLMQVIDEHWKEHLNQLVMLRSGIGLRSYGQRDPLVEYKAESFRLFEELMDTIEDEAVRFFFRAELVQAPPPPPPDRLQTRKDDAGAWAGGDRVGAPGDPEDFAHASPRGAPPGSAPVSPVMRDAPKVGRNDPCPCGSGRKYKKCHGRAE
jgi:preprotein translocase subunit SecA